MADRSGAEAAPGWVAEVDLDHETAARGGVYELCASLFTDPDADRYAALEAGAVHAGMHRLLGRTGLAVSAPDLRVDDDHETLSARFNDLFVIGYSEVVDPTDGTMANQGPPVSLYESGYRPEVSWNDVNLDLARAYDYFGVSVDEAERRNHDHLRLELEFMGYLCRREAAVDPDVGRARLDFHDRHLRVVTAGLAECLEDEAGTGLYGRLGRFLDRFSAVDQADLADRYAGDDP